MKKSDRETLNHNIGDYVFTGAMNLMYCIPYISTDSSQTAFVPVSVIMPVPDWQSLTFSVFRETTPVWSLGKSIAPGWGIGPETLRGKITYADTNTNPFMQLTDYYLKTFYNADGSVNKNKTVLPSTRINEGKDNFTDQLLNNGVVNATSTNPFDIWLFKKSRDNDVVSIIFGAKIDTGTSVHDVNSTNLRISEFNGTMHIDSAPQTDLKDILSSMNYVKYIKAIINSNNMNGRMPFHSAMQRK